MKEIWKDIKGYEGRYQVSNLGRVKSLKNLNSNNQFQEEFIMKHAVSTGKYCNVSLYKSGVKETKTIHRLVAEAFLLNPKKLRTVNHIDGNKINNCVSNLEWASYSENLKHSFSVLKRKPSKTMLGKKGLKSPRSKQVIAKTKEGKIKYYFESATAVKEKGFCRNAVSKCARGITSNYRNLIWKYV